MSGQLRLRVQHYGWRYDYGRRRVDAASYLGPVAPWAASLGQRMVGQDLLQEVPDQVIVNEYVGAQGIAAHVDCLSCFVGPIVTISLCEAWQMVFRSLASGALYAPVLPRRSAVILAGAARTDWSHEIPRRTHEVAHFSDRGRPFQFDRGRRFNMIVGDGGERASEGFIVSQRPR